MKIFTQLLVPVAVFLIWLAPVQANEAPVSPDKGVFTIMTWDVHQAEKDLVVNYTSKGRKQELLVPWRDRSVEASFDEFGPLVFTVTQARVDGPVEVPVAVADIPEGAKRLLLMLVENPAREAGGTPYLVRVMDDSHTTFPAQSVRFVNWSQVELAGMLGERMFTVGAGQSQTVPAELTGGGQLLSMRLASRNGVGGWRRLRSTMLPISEKSRVLIFLLDAKAGAGRTELVLVKDQVDVKVQL